MIVKVATAASSSIVMSAIALNSGASFLAVTLIVNVRGVAGAFGLGEAPSSTAATRTVTAPAASAAGVYVSVRVAPAPVTVGCGIIVESKLVTLNVIVCPASSAPPPAATFVIEIVPVPESSSTVMSATVSKTGASLTALTVTSTVSKALCNSPSVTKKMNESAPLLSEGGTYVAIA